MNNKYVSVQEAARILCVSEATVHNWIRHKYIKSGIRENKKTLLKRNDIVGLKQKIKSGSLNRLGKRANKTGGSSTFIPGEYIRNKDSFQRINKILDYISKSSLSTGKSLYLLTLKLLEQQEIITNALVYAEFPDPIQGKTSLTKELAGWRKLYKFTGKELGILEFDLPVERDILGLIYQSIMNNGDKSKKGAFYTPSHVVENICDSLFIPDKTVLDPCCGTGQFLLNFAATGTGPENLWGVDVDPLAVRIARVNVMLYFKNFDFSPSIFTGNFISNFKLPVHKKKFDIIATNPPWGGQNDSKSLKRLYTRFPGITSRETFSFILKHSIDLLKPEGRLSFILPESILHVRTHKDIRKYILKNTVIKRIHLLNRVFRKVFTKVIRLDLEKKEDTNGTIHVFGEESNHRIPQERFHTNHNTQFDIHISTEDSGIIDKIYSRPHTTLKGQSLWALGIVTGNNDKYILPRQIDTSEPILRGRDIQPFRIAEAGNFIRFEPSRFQQVADVKMYRLNEKLIYRFVSKKLIFAYDDKQHLTLNSANILIPQVPNYPIKAVLGLFNSPVYQFIFRKKFNSLKVLKSDLQELPLPLLEGPDLDRVTRMVDSIIAGENSQDKLNRLIFDLFGLTDRERALIFDFNKE